MIFNFYLSQWDLSSNFLVVIRTVPFFHTTLFDTWSTKIYGSKQKMGHLAHFLEMINTLIEFS